MIQASVVASVSLVAIFAWISGIAFARRPKGRLNRIFAALCILMAFISLAEAMAEDVPAARFWLKAEMAVWPFSVALALLFALEYTGRRNAPRGKATAAAHLFPALALSILNVTVQNPQGLAAGGVSWLADSSPWDSLVVIATVAWGAVLDVATLFLLIRHRRRLRERILKKQASLVATGFLLPLLAGIFSQAVLPMTGTTLLFTRYASELSFILCVGYAMWRYDLFVVDPNQAADRVLSVMREAVLLLDTEGKVAYANHSALRIWEGSSRNPVGRFVGEVLGPGFAEAGGMEKLLDGGAETAMEISSPSAGGAAVSLLVSGSLLHRGPRDVTGAVLVATDISGRKELENTLRISRGMLRSLVDHGKANIILVDPQGVIQVCNEPLARHFGHTPSSIVGRKVFSLFSGDVAKDRQRRLSQVVDSGVPSHYEESRGGRHWDHHITPVKDEEGKVIGATVFTMDVTERVEAEIARERLIGELSDALARVKTLTGLIPICSHCKRIRNDKGYWQQVEQYVSERTDADFSHGLCNDCLRKLYPDVAGEVLDKDTGPK